MIFLQQSGPATQSEGPSATWKCGVTYPKIIENFGRPSPGPGYLHRSHKVKAGPVDSRKVRETRRNFGSIFSKSSFKICKFVLEFLFSHVSPLIRPLRLFFIWKYRFFQNVLVHIVLQKILHTLVSP